jgi:signal transduction histidine kinase
MSSPQAGCLPLADFIDGNLEAIVAEWEDFARANWPGEVPGSAELCDNAMEMLMAVAADMRAFETARRERHGSEGAGKAVPTLEGTAVRHARERISSGFDIVQVVAEFRALRASVMRIWRGSHSTPHAEQVDDLIHFNEAIDQLVATSVEPHSARVEQGRRLFMGIIGHDLRQPLCSVRLLVSALIRAGDAIDIPPVLAKIQQSVEGMDALVRDLMDLSSARLGVKMTVYPQTLDLTELAGEALIQAESANPRRSFKLVSVGDLYGEWDGLRLRQLLANLLENAAQHGSDSTAVELILHPTADDKGVEIRVRNQGRQIPKEVLDVMFEPLMRHAHGEAASRPGSVGLGLYICREIVKAHQGEMAVESTAEGITTFTVVLPRLTLATAAGDEMRAEEVAGA